jgi:hypothetical protein
LSPAYPTQAAAIAAAIDAAQKDGEYGNQAEVLIHGPDLRFSAVWTYGLDTYPPRPEIFESASDTSKKP